MARGRRRGCPVPDPALRRLAESVGANKLGPDVSAQEVYYSRSLKIRRLILEFLKENEETTWTNLAEIHARAALHAGCSPVTSARWIFTYTRVGGPCRIVEAVDHMIIQRRENSGPVKVTPTEVRDG